MSRNERTILQVVIATGISSVVVQLITIREFLALFQGNEFVIALILFSWLALGGIGTRMAQWAKHYRQATAKRLALLSVLLAALAPIHLLGIRLAHPYLFLPGSSVGFYPTLSYVLLTIAPYTLLIGFVLPYSLFVLRNHYPDYAGARIYITDNLGDVIGGALFSFVLIYWATPFSALFWANLPLLICSLRLLWPSLHFHLNGALLGGLVLAVLVTGLLLEPLTLTAPEGELLWYRESRYGRLAVQQDREQITLFRNGVPLFSNQNQVLAEETIHYPLSQIESPRAVLLLSYEGGTLQELHKYPLESIDYVELDAQVTNALLRFGLIDQSDGFNRFHQDGRSFLAARHKKYDAIVINLPEPDTFQTNRFFTDQFFSLASDRLTDNGLLSFCMSGFDSYLDEPQRQKLSSLYNTAKHHFNEVLLLPGQRIFFLCRNAAIATNIPERLANRGIEAPYIRGYFKGDVTAERIERLNLLMDPKAPINQDLFPRLIPLMFSQWFAKFSSSPTLFIVALLILLVVYGCYLTIEEFVLFSTGFMTMGSEILVIFAFQIFFGYIYFQIGMIVTVFLAGLLPGAWFGQRLASRKQKLLALIDTLLMALMILFILALHVGASRLPSAFFLVFGFSVALACGFQFPVALRMAGDGKTAITQTFSADLIGAACGTLITSLLLIPYLGVIGAASGLIVLKSVSFILLRRSNE
jgi:spermidine synthase